MYRKSRHEDELPEIGLYFEGRLNPENRWVKMAERLPWQELEADYAKHFKSCGRGEVALNVRVAMGALIIKEILCVSDRAVVDAVSENPYLQYFLGFKHFQTEPPFNASLMTHFRKRFPAEVINRFNEKVIELARKDSSPEDDPPPDGGGTSDSDTKESNHLIVQDIFDFHDFSFLLATRNSIFPWSGVIFFRVDPACGNSRFFPKEKLVS